MTELTAHKRQVPLAPEATGHQPDHLVQRNAPVDNQGFRIHDTAHVEVHLLVHEPHGDGLVADDGLVVGLGVGDALLPPPAVLERVGEMPHVPLVVRLLLEHLDPQVGQGHRQPIIKTKPALRHRPAQGRHPTHILRHSHRRARAQPVHQVIRQHHVHAALHIRGRAEILVVSPRESSSQPVVVVQHGGDSIEAEAVETVVVDPPPQIREQEAHDLPLPVVKQLRVPSIVVALGPPVGVAVIRPVLLRDPVQGVRGHVRVHQVHQHDDPHAVRGVHQALQVLGGAAPAGGGEEGGHVVPEAAVVGVLCDGHELHCVVPQALDAGEDYVGELGVRRHPLMNARHPHVRLVDPQ
mmetsp:Transcript_29626/g.71148  ORF Transcript_29626/g.71148 Transcript_29626/m.71148 type:complete len:352 (-) Transcript_29626:192-1247(-)